METHRRGLDGRRIFNSEFKREQIGRVLRGEISLAELTRELDVSPSVVRRWKHLADRGSETAMTANEEVVPIREYFGPLSCIDGVSAYVVQDLLLRFMKACFADLEAAASSV